MKRLIVFLGMVLCSMPIQSEEYRPVLTQEDRQAWILCLKRVKMKPPCCGACKIITNADLKILWNYLTATTVNEEAVSTWEIHKSKLLEEFKHLYPERYKVLYENQKK